jgi:hypothetical protein
VDFLDATPSSLLIPISKNVTMTSSFSEYPEWAEVIRWCSYHPKRPDRRDYHALGYPQEVAGIGGRGFAGTRQRESYGLCRRLAMAFVFIVRLSSNGSTVAPGATAQCRDTAKWLAALESLERKGLIRATSPEKHFYAVTQQGYDLAEQFGPFVRWTTSEIVLQAYYLDRSTESMTLACTGVIEVPPIFYPDQYGAGGAGAAEF